MASNDQGERLHALDALRAIALLCGVALHSALSYAPGVDSHLWPFKDVEQGLAMSVMIFLVHIFRMPVFFLLAGFFAHMLFQRQGARQFLRNRAGRILLPLILGLVVCSVCIVGVVLWFLVKTHGGHLPRSIPPAFANMKPSFGHLWFLYILCWLYPSILLLRRAVCACDGKNMLARLADRLLCYTWTSPLQSLLLAVPITAAFLLQPGWQAWFGIPTPGYTLIPPLVPLCIYGYIFGLGWTLKRQTSLLEQLAGTWPTRLLIGLAAALVCLVLAGPEVSIAVTDDMQTKLPYAVFYSIATVSLMLGFIGLGVRFLANASPVARYVADASYWMYIAHLPLVMALQVGLMPFQLHWSIKFVIVAATTCAVLLLAYRYTVRSTWVGQMLNGRKYSKASYLVAGELQT